MIAWIYCTRPAERWQGDGRATHCRLINGLVGENLHRTPWIFPWNMGLSCKFSLKPIHWTYDDYLWIETWNLGWTLGSKKKLFFFRIKNWLVVTGTWLDYDFPFSWEWNNHPNWRTHSIIFQDGVGLNHQPPTRGSHGKLWTIPSLLFIDLIPSGKLTVCYWKWPSRNSGFSHSKWWIFP